MNRPLSNHWLRAFFVIISVNFLYQYTTVSESFFSALKFSLFESIILIGIYFLCTQKKLYDCSVVFLFIPYLFFIPGWLNTPTAIVTGGMVIFCLSRILGKHNGPESIRCDWGTLAAFLLIVAYINLAGIGDYGYQSPDHSMHNSRLNDLILHEWPVKYAENKHLVYYVGYFLPAAVIGKLTHYGIANYFLYFWAIMGVTLAFRWLQYLCGWRLSGWLVLIFMLFGSLDIFNTLFVGYGKNVSPAGVLFPLDIGRFEFITGEKIDFFLGNYLSHTLQLYFSPHQVIAGWIGSGLLAYSYFSKQPRQILFIFALLSLWSPFVMLGMGIIVLIILMDFARKDWRSVATLENFSGAIICLLFVVFYLGGSAEQNPSFSLFHRLDTAGDYLALLILLFAGWGIYAALIWPYIQRQEVHHRVLFGSLLASLVLLPCWIFGSYNDLFCRGSAPLMFLLLAYLLKATMHYWKHQNKWLLLAITVFFLAGSLSALQQHAKALYFYGETQLPTTVLGTKYSWENLGPDHSVFGKYFRAD